MLIWGRKGRSALRRLVSRAQDIRQLDCGGRGEDVVVKAFRGDGPCSSYGKQGRLHGKVLLSEGYVSIGSANLDGPSLERDLELNVVSADKELIQTVNREFFQVGGSEQCGETFGLGNGRGGRGPAREGPDQKIREIDLSER